MANNTTSVYRCTGEGCSHELETLTIQDGFTECPWCGNRMNVLPNSKRKLFNPFEIVEKFLEKD